jgi:hypothetical protein
VRSQTPHQWKPKPPMIQFISTHADGGLNKHCYARIPTADDIDDTIWCANHIDLSTVPCQAYIQMPDHEIRHRKHCNK